MRFRDQPSLDRILIDPKEQLVGLYMVQASADDTRFLRRQFRSMVGAALLD